jgi:hypothetical protein
MDHGPTLKHSIGRQLLWWWGASFLGGGVAGGLLFVLVWWMQSLVLLADGSWILGATGVGIAQSFVFPSAVLARRRWIGVTVLSATLYVGLTRLGAWLAQQERVTTGPLLQWLVSLVIAMLLLGLCQAVVLHRAYRRAGWWVGAAILGGLISGVLEHELMSRFSGQVITSVGQGLVVWSLTMGIRWLILTAWMGIVLVTLLRRRDDAAGLVPHDGAPAGAQE